MDFLYDVQDEKRVFSALQYMPAAEQIEQLANFYKIMGDPSRLMLLMALEKGELCASDLANVAKMSRSAVSHQLRILKQARLVKFQRDGKNVIYSLSDDHVYTMLAQGITHVCE